jgi:hypothetical protein
MKVSSLFLTAAMVILVCSTAKAEHETRSDRTTFAARRHMDVLADRMWKDANQVCWEMYRHYGHNRGFRETYREMYRAMKDAQHIHDLVHDGAHRGRHDVDHIASDLHEIDRLFHHIEGDIRGWSSSYRGHYGHGAYGHAVHGQNFADELTRKMRYFEQTLHHLMADYGVKSQLVEQEPGSAPPPAANGGAPPRRVPNN